MTIEMERHMQSHERMSMAQFETFSTAGQPSRQRAAYWNQLMKRTSFTSATFDPLDPGNFSAELTRIKIGDIWCMEVSTAAATVRHPPSDAALDGAIYTLHLVLEGSSMDRQWGRQCRLRAGDFALYASGPGEPFEATHEGPVRCLLLGIPSHTLRRYLPCPERVIALPVSGHAGVGALVTNLLRDFWRSCREQPGEMTQPRLLHGILELVAVAYANTQQAAACPSQSAAYHKGQILAYIESHLSATDLTPTRIATALHMTPRNLHYLFASEGETVARYILRRRLEESIRALTRMPPQQRTLTEIALDLGFGSVTHFGRAFRRCYGVTPSEYRRGIRRPLADTLGAVTREKSSTDRVAEYAGEEIPGEDYVEE
jgi:AraC family transcriptional regulator, positive regulator of tynA and feaB